MMKLSTSTLRTCLVALDAAYDREESVTAKLRISNASREISELLAAGPDVQPEPTGTEPFRSDELFFPGSENHYGGTGHECQECGATVTDTFKHTEWHNKVADL